MSEFNADLVDDLARRRVVLFLGAGVSASAATRTGGRIKGWEAFLNEMNGKAGAAVKEQVTRLLDQKDYLLACEILQMDLGERWEREIVQERFHCICIRSKRLMRTNRLSGLLVF